MKRIFALAALCAAGSSAASDVTFYGVMDVGISQDRGGINGVSTRVTSGMATQSRWGFKGSEDLGDGMSAFFAVEGGIHADTGIPTQNGTLFGRTSIAGLRGRLGAVSVGLQDTPLFTTLNTVIDPLRNGVGRSNNLMPPAGFRAGNSILFRSADWHGFSADAMVVAGEAAGNSEIGRQFGGSAGYSNGRFNVRLALHNRSNVTATAPDAPAARNWLLGANYDLQAVKLYGGLGVNRGPNSSPLNSAGAPFGGVAPVASSASNDALLGISVPRGSWTYIATVVHKDDRTRLNQDALQTALYAAYAFSKRTDVYAAHVLIHNRHGAGYTAGNSEEPGTGNRQVAVGLRHRF
ncbi:porin [Pseudoduganella ginsengisoli]|uniref:Porin n=1 Tax=Pseudoduganella ginsengisoli TaxID=1462440 RepID=A0A6L6Q4J9_9BURK|nr:porin [Pseudoduganella ginsengisoli]MTW04763.1 porin [Pseudoduganella ginsengisoli]